MANEITASPSRRNTVRQDPLIVRWTLILLAFAVVGVIVILPLVSVFVQAFTKGLLANRQVNPT